MKNTYFLLSLMVALVLGLAAWSTPDENDWERKVDATVLQEAQQGQNVEFLVVMAEQADVSHAKTLKTKEAKGTYVFNTLQQTALRTQAQLTTILEQNNADFRSFVIVNAVWVKGDINLIQAIAQLNEVAELQANPTTQFQAPRQEAEDPGRSPSAIEWGITRIGADDVWAEGYTGQGIIVAGQDTGYEWDHPALIKNYKGWDGTNVDHNYNWHDAIHSNGGNNPCGVDSTEPCDDNNHGTHTMGTMIGTDGADNQIGVAPGAKFICCRNMDQGNGTPATYLECYNWFLAPTDIMNANPTPSKAPHVINNSWSCPESEGCNSSNWWMMQTAVNNLRNAGVVVVVSAGNSGSSCETIRTPSAIFDESYTVGSTTITDALSNFSSRGPVTVDGSMRMKPDIAAPGSSVRSAVRNGGYATYSGTSMAGPHVAGAIALLLSARPDLIGDVDGIEAALNQAAVAMTTSEGCGGDSSTDVPNNSFGHGRLDILSAILIVATQEIPDLEHKVAIFPNPFQASLSINFVDLKGETSLELFTATGKKVLQENYELSDDFVGSIPVKDLAPGIYFYRVTNGEEIIGGKLVKEQ